VRAHGRASTTALAVVAIVLGAGVAGFLLHHLTRPERSTLRPAPPAAAAVPVQAASPAAPASPAPAVPEMLPDFSLPDLNGVEHRLSDWHGRPLVINFWATWCEPCRREIPLLKALRRENRGIGLEVVGIAIDQPDPVRKLANDLGIEYPVLVGEKGGLEAVTAFGMDTVLPFTVFADGQGRIVRLKVGELHRDEATFILARLTDLAARRLTLAEAREQIAAESRRLAAARAGAEPSGSQ
jgi:thiol-disulfide isomerase/thioredoxin